MKKYLLPENGTFYKANLHMHTTVSDGQLSPEETKKAYQEKGYSVVAFTDHEVLVPHTDLTDEKFVALTAAELAFNVWQDKGGYPYVQTYHINLYSKTADKCVLPIWDPDLLLDCVQDKIPEAQKAVTYKRTYGVDAVNAAIAKANADGFFVSYNHPTWSLQNFTDYGGLEGVWGIECFNSSAARVGLMDTDRPFHDVLALGKTVFPLATDDAHTKEDCFGGFVMLKAEKLTYDNVIAALEKGDFYASTAPEIYELSIEDGIVHIVCSPVKEVRMQTECRIAESKRATDGAMTEAYVDLRPYFQHKDWAGTWRKPFVRFTLVDEQGNVAYTRAYNMEELQ